MGKLYSALFQCILAIGHFDLWPNDTRTVKEAKVKKQKKNKKVHRHFTGLTVEEELEMYSDPDSQLTLADSPLPQRTERLKYFVKPHEKPK